MALKSAYELAMERMGKSGSPSAPLSAAQKARLAELDKVYKAKIAEAELRLKPKIEAAEFSGQGEEADKLRAQLAKELQSLREEWEAKKEKIRQEAAQAS